MVDPHLGCDVGEHGGFKATSLGLAAADDVCSLGDGVLYELGDAPERELVDERADLRAWLPWVAERQRAGSLAQLLGEFFGDVPVDDDPFGRQADLPLVHEGAEVRRVCARSRSASASTSSGALPPSSSSTRLRWRPAFSATIRPTRVEPVKLIRLTAGCAISSSTTSAASSGSLVTTPTAPLGTPASVSASTIAACVRGHCSDAFSTTVLP